jgi:hypothetical protein
MIRAVKFQNSSVSKTEDCLVLRRSEEYPMIEMAFPFHDTLPFRFTLAEAHSLLHALDEMLDVRSLPSPENKK